MMIHMRGIGALGLLLVAVLSHPDVAAAHGAVSGEDDPCLRQVEIGRASCRERVSLVV